MRDREIRIKIDAYVNGRLSEDEIETLWIEFAKNPDLLVDLEIEAGVKHLLEQKKGEHNRIVYSGRTSQWVWHAAAAAVILLVALVQLFRVDTPTELNEFVIAEIEPRHYETSNHVRGDEYSTSPADSMLDSAFATYFNGNTVESIRVLDSIIDTYDNESLVSKAWLNKGIVLYNNGNFSQSVTAFKNAAELSADSSITKEKAYWFLANAHVKTADLKPAQEAAYKTYLTNGIFKKDAFLLLMKLSGELNE